MAQIVADFSAPNGGILRYANGNTLRNLFLVVWGLPLHASLGNASMRYMVQLWLSVVKLAIGTPHEPYFTLEPQGTTFYVPSVLAKHGVLICLYTHPLPCNIMQVRALYNQNP